MNGHHAIGGANHLDFARLGGPVRSMEGLAAQRRVAAADLGPVEDVQDAVVVDAPVKVRSAPPVHAPAVNTGTVSHRTSAILVYQAAE